MKVKPAAILVTGAARRLGREIALACASRGYAVIAHHRTPGPDVTALNREVRALGAACYPVRAGFPEGAEKLMRECRKLPVTLAGLVNCASIFEKGNPRDSAPAEIRRIFTLNAFVPLYLCREFGRTAQSGLIVNFLDANIDRPNDTFELYRMTKRLLRLMTLDLARSLAPKIRVNAIAPGALLPSKFSGRDFHKKIGAPLKTGGTLETLRRAMVYLLESQDVTGQILFVDGGIHLR